MHSHYYSQDFYIDCQMQVVIKMALFEMQSLLAAAFVMSKLGFSWVYTQSKKILRENIEYLFTFGVMDSLKVLAVEFELERGFLSYFHITNLLIEYFTLSKFIVFQYQCFKKPKDLHFKKNLK